MSGRLVRAWKYQGGRPVLLKVTEEEAKRLGLTIETGSTEPADAETKKRSAKNKGRSAKDKG